MNVAGSTADFLRALEQSGLLPPEQFADFARWAAASKTDAQGIAKELHRHHWLTSFQIREIYKGRGRELRIGPYVLQDLLGEGGMGRVYKAHHTRLGRDVALKIIRKEKLANRAAKERFRSEIQAIAQMSHPNVVTAYDADQIGDIHFYAMEFVDGSDLTNLVKDRGPLPIPEACEYIRQASLGIHHAFEIGLVHRDVKPSNILVTRKTRQVKVVDLGLALLSEMLMTPGANRLTHDGFVLGTPDFLSPEQARNPSGVDIRADIYALGGTLYFLLTGSPPFDGVSPADKLVQHCTAPLPDLRVKRPDAPRQVADLIRWCLAKKPEDRPQTPAELALALQPFCSLLGPEAPTTIAPRHAPPVVANPVPMAQPISLDDCPPTDEPAAGPSPFVMLDAQDADPIRERAQRPRSSVLPVLFGLGGMVILMIVGYAAYRTIMAPPPAPLPKQFTNSNGMKFVLLDGGSFRMGSEDDEPGHKPDESPLRAVSLREPFYIGITEVTQGQYAQLMGANPAESSRIGRGGSETPVENVTWQEAVDFCAKLTREPGTREGWAYRLPTEAEWEFACRATSAKPFAFGERLTFPTDAHFTKGRDDVDPLGEQAEGILKPPVSPDRVAKRPANAWGLYDMHGNVAEWCGDWFAHSYPSSEPAANPRGPDDGSRRVVRGGSWRDPATACRSAARRSELPITRSDDVGFRVVYAPVVK